MRRCPAWGTEKADEEEDCRYHPYYLDNKWPDSFLKVLVSWNTTKTVFPISSKANNNTDENKVLLESNPTRLTQQSGLTPIANNQPK